MVLLIIASERSEREKKESYKLQASSSKQRLTMDPGDGRMNLERNNYE